MNSGLDNDYIDAIQSWRDELNQKLRVENGWLALAGLFWLDEGPNSFGSSPDCDIVIPKPDAPGHLGTFTRDGDRVYYDSNPGGPKTVKGKEIAAKQLTPDTDSDPDIITHGDLSFVLIRRGTRLGIRLWDNSRDERRTFPERAWFPINSGYRLPAEFIPTAGDRTIPVPDVLGEVSEEKVMGEYKFELEGELYKLLALEADDEHAFIIFADRTNGRATYPGGRFLIADMRENGSVWLDFNQAYNPPCAFTAYATCPLPPTTNKLPVEINAGERYLPETLQHGSLTA